MFRGAIQRAPKTTYIAEVLSMLNCLLDTLGPCAVTLKSTGSSLGRKMLKVRRCSSCDNAAYALSPHWPQSPKTRESLISYDRVSTDIVSRNRRFYRGREAATILVSVHGSWALRVLQFGSYPDDARCWWLCSDQAQQSFTI